MPTLSLPDNWATWPTVIGQVLTDPALKRPGEFERVTDENGEVVYRRIDEPNG